MKKKTIVHIIPRFYSGGAERLVLEYAKRLDKNKYEVHVVSCVEDGDLRAEFEAISGVRIFVGSRSKHGGRWGAWKAVRSYLDSVKPDILHTHLLSSDTIAYLYKKKTKKPFKWISTLHNVEHNSPLLYKIVWRHVLHKVDRVIAVAPRVVEYAKHIFKVSESKVSLVLNGIDVGVWSKIASHKPFKNKDFTFATIGRLEKQKGHTFLLEALSQLSFDNWTYHVYGDGSLEAELKTQADKLGIGERVVWHGMTEQVHEEIKDVDLIIQPSLWEGLSLVVMEVMTAGRCVLTTDTGGEGLVDDEKTGFVVPHGESESLGERIEYICDNIKESGRVAKGAHDYALDHFAIQNNIDEVEKLYDSK